MACASEAWSCVEPMTAANWLRQKESWHPVGVYARRDFETRDRCRQAVENLDAGSAVGELAIADAAVDQTIGG